MLHGAIAIVLLTFSAAKNIANAQDSKLVDKVFTKFFHRALVAQPVSRTDLEETTVMKCCAGPRTPPEQRQVLQALHEQIDKFKDHMVESGDNLRELLQEQIAGALGATEQALLDEVSTQNRTSQIEVLQAKSASFLSDIVSAQIDRFKDHLAQSGETLRERLQDDITE